MQTSFFFFFSLLCFFKCKTEKNKILYFENSNGGRQWDEGHPSSDTNCWGEGGRQCGRDHTIRICEEEILAYRRYETEYREREREREAQIISLLAKCNSYNNEQPTFTKGYKVTLYSDSLRATALYAIYINSLDYDCPKGQCEYGHYTLVFDTPIGRRSRSNCVTWGLLYPNQTLQYSSDKVDMCQLVFYFVLMI